MPLVYDPDLSQQEITQYYLYQIKVFEKVFTQLSDYSLSKKFDKINFVMSLLMEYGELSAIRDCSLEQNLRKDEIFEKLRDL